MGSEEKINIDIFKVVTRAIAESDNLVIMANHLTQLLVGAMEIKGCTIFVLNPETKELEILASFGLSINYINKGPVLSNKSIARTIGGEPCGDRGCLHQRRTAIPGEHEKRGNRGHCCRSHNVFQANNRSSKALPL